MTNISHIGAKYLRPLFSLYNSGIIKKEEFQTYLDVKNNRIFPDLYINYYNILVKLNILKEDIRIKLEDGMKEYLLEELEIINKLHDKTDFEKVNRILEITDLLENG
jgi:hypothetical protein